jgi:hypothetical protein
MSPVAVEAASEPPEAVLEPQPALVATVVVVGEGLVAAVVLELEPLLLEPQPASTAVATTTAVAKRIDRRW